ncbi:response regulator [uncultured Roseovarius sp.]|uniref:response regulator n=1 Tax=uncultured Roseovarius sp. TaxID=293344 RepID=UPI00260D4F1E|nr:response regulator [uncultured Roseovarius sp.]
MIERAQNQSILIVEDNDDDFEAVESAIQSDGRFIGLIERCASGHDALDFLTSRGAYEPPNDKPLPALILLDLNLLGVTGLEVISRIKNEDDLLMIPVIVLTSSTDRRDIEASYRAGANAYLQKQMELDGLLASIVRLREFWLNAVILPAVE